MNKRLLPFMLYVNKRTILHEGILETDSKAKKVWKLYLDMKTIGLYGGTNTHNEIVMGSGY